MKKIGVISDTHYPRRRKSLPEELLRGLQGVDLILHAGDLTDEEMLWLLEEIAPVTAVAGNCDGWDLAEHLGEKKIITVERVKIGLTHGYTGQGRTTLERAFSQFAGEGIDCLVFGHSHQPYNSYHQGLLFFNPGSPTDKRSCPDYSYGILEVNGKNIKGYHYYF